MPNPTCPFAKQRPLARAASKPTIRPTASAAHTAVTTANGQQLGDFFEHADADAHFYVDHDGTLWQYLPVDRKSWAQYSGNDHAVAYETWDGGNPATPWTPAQMHTIAQLLAWLYRTWDIPLDVSTTSTGPGVGWHSKYPAWNRDGHQCPGPTRVGQLVQEVLPAAHKLVDLPPPPQEEQVATTPVTIKVDHTTGKGWAVVAGVQRDSFRSVTAVTADDGTVAKVGVGPKPALDGDLIVNADLGTPTLIDVTVDVIVAHV